MYCLSCGREYDDNMKFCPYCGAPAVKSEHQQTEGQNPEANNVPPYNQPPYGQQNYGGQSPYGNEQQYANQPPYGQVPYGQNPYGYNQQNPNDVPSAGFNALAFFFPIVGLILYLVWKDETPKKAKAIGKWALISVIAGVIFYIIMMIAMVAIFMISGVSTYSYMM